MIDSSESVQLTKNYDGSKLSFTISGNNPSKVKEEAEWLEEKLQADPYIKLNRYNSERDINIQNTRVTKYSASFEYHSCCEIARVWNG